MNTKRHSDFIKLKHKIQSCEKLSQLNSLRQVILHYSKNQEDRAELMAYFIEKEQDLSPDYRNEIEYEIRNNPYMYEDEILTSYHQKLSPQ